MSSLAAELGVLIPAISSVVRHAAFDRQILDTPSMIPLMRDFWLLVVMFGFVTESAWLKAWKDDLRAIATKTPSLVPENDPFTYLQMELDRNPVLSFDAKSQVANTVQAASNTLFGDNSQMILLTKTLSIAQRTFYVAVWSILLLQSQSGLVHGLFSYAYRLRAHDDWRIYVEQLNNAVIFTACMLILFRW